MINLNKFRYGKNRDQNASPPDKSPEPAKHNDTGQNSNHVIRGKRKYDLSADEESSENIYQKHKKTRITHFMKKKRTVTKSPKNSFISPESGSDSEGPATKGANGKNGDAIDIRNHQAHLISPQKHSQNSNDGVCDSPLFISKRNRLDSNEKPGKSKIGNSIASRKILGYSSESSDNEDAGKPKGPFPRLNCIIPNSNSNSEKEKVVKKRDSDEKKNLNSPSRLSNGENTNGISSTKNQSWKSPKKKVLSSEKTKSFSKDCGPEDNAVDENFHLDFAESSGEDSDEFRHFGKQKRKNILEFFQNTTMEELTTIHSCSKKKAKLVIGLQPFKSWKDLVGKLEKTKYLNSELLRSCSDLLKERMILQSLLKECRRISNDLTVEIESLGLRDHMTEGNMVMKAPTTIPSNLKLKPYQLVGLNWIALLHRNKVNGVLADEMGLGKTVQTISFLAHLLEQNQDTGPHVIIVPSSTLDNWCRELNLWCPAIKYVLYHGSQLERRSIRADFLRGCRTTNVIITTYNCAISSPEDRIFFRKTEFEYAVFDEGHMLKNMSSQRYMNLMKIKASRRLLLTGTPLQNNLLELMSLLRFVMPHMFEQTTDTLIQIFSTSSSESKSKFAKDRIRDAKNIMQPFVLRRLKDEVLNQLPDKRNETLHCEMTTRQAELYEETKERYRRKMHKNSSFELKSAFVELRKVANHPLLRRNVFTADKLVAMAKLLKKEPEYSDSQEALIVEDMEVMTDFELDRFCRSTGAIRRFSLDESLVLNSGKFKKLDSLLPGFKSKGSQVVIFSQYTMIMDIIEIYLKKRSHKFLRLDGSTPVNTRLDLIDRFTNDPSIFVFLLSTKAGGLGINLTAANVVILHDIDMNPYNDKQAEDRCHRLGQTKTVQIIRMVSKDTLEEGMLEMAQNKLQLEQEMIGNADYSNDIASLLQKTLAT